MNRDCLQFLPAEVIDRQVVRDLEQPGRELVGAVVAIEIIESADKGFLSQVFSSFSISDHSINNREHRPLEAIDQLPGGSIVTTTTQDNQLLVTLVRVVHRESGSAAKRREETDVCALD